MKRIGILTAGGDTPALNATIYGAVQRANQLQQEVLGIINGFAGLLDPRVPHVTLNPHFSTIPELDPIRGGTLLGASRTYLDPHNAEEAQGITERLHRLNIEGLVCIGGDGTMNGMQVLAGDFPCVLAPKTIDNDLGLNYLDETNDWQLEGTWKSGKPRYRYHPGRETIDPAEMVNYVTAGFATAVYVVSQGVERIRTTAESHRRIAITEVMGRQSGFIALGSAYGQPDLILIPEVPLDLPHLAERIRELFEYQQNVVIVVGEGIVDANGNELGAVETSVDPAGKVLYSGAAETLKNLLMQELGDKFVNVMKNYGSSSSPIFTRKVGHTQRGGRPIHFDRQYAAQIGGKAVDLLVEGRHGTMATLQWSAERGFYLDSIPAEKLRDRHNVIQPRMVHPSLYDADRFQPSKLGREYLLPIFSNAIDVDDVEVIRSELFRPDKLTTPCPGVNADVRKRIRYLDEPG